MSRNVLTNPSDCVTAGTDRYLQKLIDLAATGGRCNCDPEIRPTAKGNR